MKSKRKMPGQHISEISLRYAKSKPTVFYKTGIKELDEYTGGLPSGEATIIAARPGVGKTSAAMQFLEHIGTAHNASSGFFSIEMSGKQLVTRMILARTGLPSVALRKGELTQKQLKLRDDALKDIAKLPIYIEDSSIATIPHVEKVALAWIKAGIKIFALDYIQLMSVGRIGNGDTRANLVGECMRALKRIAKEHDVAFLILSQLNRESMKAKRPPTSADLKDSGEIEQVADNIIIIHPDRENPPYHDFILDKWRNGPMGTISTQFDASRTRFESVEKED